MRTRPRPRRVTPMSEQILERTVTSSGSSMPPMLDSTHGGRAQAEADLPDRGTGDRRGPRAGRHGAVRHAAGHATMSCSARFPRRRPLEARRQPRRRPRRSRRLRPSRSPPEDEGPAHQPRPVRAAGRQAGTGPCARSAAAAAQPHLTQPPRPPRRPPPARRAAPSPP